MKNPMQETPKVMHPKEEDACPIKNCWHGCNGDYVQPKEEMPMYGGGSGGGAVDYRQPKEPSWELSDTQPELEHHMKKTTKAVIITINAIIKDIMKYALIPL